VGKNTRFPRELDPFPPIHLAGGGGRRDEKKLDSRVLLALRQLPPLAEGGVAGPNWAESSALRYGPMVCVIQQLQKPLS
jgi:hypothetical protein